MPCLCLYFIICKFCFDSGSHVGLLWAKPKYTHRVILMKLLSCTCAVSTTFSRSGLKKTKRCRLLMYIFIYFWSMRADRGGGGGGGGGGREMELRYGPGWARAPNHFCGHHNNVSYCWSSAVNSTSWFSLSPCLASPFRPRRSRETYSTTLLSAAEKLKLRAV